MMRDGRHDPSAIGYVLVASAALAGLFRWLSGLTVGDEHGGRYDLPMVNAVAWFAFLLLATVAIMALVGAVFRLAALVRPPRDRPTMSS